VCSLPNGTGHKVTHLMLHFKTHEPHKGGESANESKKKIISPDQYYTFEFFLFNARPSEQWMQVKCHNRLNANASSLAHVCLHVRASEYDNKKELHKCTFILKVDNMPSHSIAHSRDLSHSPEHWTHVSTPLLLHTICARPARCSFFSLPQIDSCGRFIHQKKIFIPLLYLGLARSLTHSLTEMRFNELFSLVSHASAIISRYLLTRYRLNEKSFN
jgi:hypothetical protein